MQHVYVQQSNPGSLMIAVFSVVTACEAIVNSACMHLTQTAGFPGAMVFIHVPYVSFQSPASLMYVYTLGVALIQPD